ncbi:MAG: ATP-binding cassette domain-containing protein [Christensenellaceae bacterium]
MTEKEKETSMETVLKINGICKRYRDAQVLTSVSMTVRKGDVYGFVGKNGAGKTTLVRIVAGLTDADRGEFELFGVSSNSKKIDAARRRICSMVETPAVYPDLSAEENMKTHCLITRRNFSRIGELLAFVGLSETGKKKAKDFSLGMRQRLAIAMALISEPELMLLDEPINGLDPEGIRQVRELLLRLHEQRGVTILISSHILTELSLFATRYGFIDGGRLIKEASPEEIAKATSEGCYIESDNAEKAARILTSLGYLPKRHEDGLQLDRDIDLMKVCRAFEREQINLTKHIRNNLDLEGYFMNLIGQERRATS